MHRDLNAPRNRILFADPIEHDVYRTDEDLPQTVYAEEMTEHIEVLALQCLGPSLTLLHVTQCVDLEKQLPG